MPLVIEEELRKSFEKAVKEVGERLKIDFDKIPFNEFLKGVEVEMEHKDLAPTKDLTGKRDVEFFAKIALVHLKESPKYYVELNKMEKKLKKESVITVIKTLVKEDVNFKHKLKFELSKDEATGVEKTEIVSISSDFETIDGQMLHIGTNLFARMTNDIKSAIVAIDCWKDFYVKVSKLTNDGYFIEPHLFEVDVPDDISSEEEKAA